MTVNVFECKIRGRPDQRQSLRSYGRKNNICIFIVCVSKTDTPRGVLDYRSKLVTALKNKESIETKVDGAKRLAEFPLSPICPLRSCFLYTLRLLIIHVAFCKMFELFEAC